MTILNKKEREMKAKKYLGARRLASCTFTEVLLYKVCDAMRRLDAIG
jgi:hypothetical protein